MAVNHTFDITGGALMRFETGVSKMLRNCKN